MFDVRYSRQAARFLKNSEKTLAGRILAKIEELSKTPVSHDSKTIEGYKEKLYRVRVGSCRILYEVDYSNKMIGIVKIDKRSKIY